jgi:hypothetical protein
LTTHPQTRPVAYQPMTLVDMAGHVATARDDRHLWRLIAEFLEEHRHGLVAVRATLLTKAPEQMLAVCARVFPDERLPERAYLVLADLFEEMDSAIRGTGD